MADAQLEKTKAYIHISNSEYQLVSQGEMIKFEGFLKAYGDNITEKSTVLPPLLQGDVLNLKEIFARETFSHHPARYAEASLVKKLEEMGIGRPSTYAPTISTIQRRQYVKKETREGNERKYQLIKLIDKKVISSIKIENTGAEKNKLFPTDIGMIVTDFLVEHFGIILDYSFTARVEKDFDEIAKGNKKWNRMMDSFYKEFHPLIEFTENLSRKEVSGDRELGMDPKTGLPVIARLGKFGPLVQIGASLEKGAEGEKPKYASMRKGQLIETITLEEAIDLFKLPRTLGEYENKVVVVAIGRFGPYIRHNNKFASLPKEDDPMKIKLEKAIELIEVKRKLDAEKHIKSFNENPDVQVLNGRYGPYIKVGKKNVKIPKGKDPKTLTLEECLKLEKKTPAKKGKNRVKKKKK
jgi:DNA topoisomerase-1